MVRNTSGVKIKTRERNPKARKGIGVGAKNVKRTEIKNRKKEGGQGAERKELLKRLGTMTQRKRKKL